MTKGTEKDVLILQLETRIQLGTPPLEKATESRQEHQVSGGLRNVLWEKMPKGSVEELDLFSLGK